MDNKNSGQPDFKIIYSCESVIQAEVILSLLKSNSIDCFTSSQSLINIFSLTPAVSNPLEIRVRVEDFEKAEAILSASFDAKELEQTIK